MRVREPGDGRRLSGRAFVYLTPRWRTVSAARQGAAPLQWWAARSTATRGIGVKRRPCPGRGCCVDRDPQDKPAPARRFRIVVSGSRPLGPIGRATAGAKGRADPWRQEVGGDEKARRFAGARPVLGGSTAFAQRRCVAKSAASGVPITTRLTALVAQPAARRGSAADRRGRWGRAVVVGAGVW